MRTKSFLLASVLTFLMPLSALALGIQVMIDGQAVTFTDVPQTAWFAAHVRSAAEAGIVNGYKDEQGKLIGLYGPSNNITIAEALKIQVEGAGYDERLYASRIESGFDNHWASPYASVAKGEAFAVIDARTRLDSPATRGEVAALLTSAFRVNLDDVSIGTRYSDVSTATLYGKSIEVLSRDGVVAGDTDIKGNATGTFRPSAYINRAEVAKMIMGARAKYGTPGVGRTPSEEEGGMNAEGNIVTYSDAGFSPMILRIKVGQSVTFKNDSSVGLWVASNPHPEHTSLTGFDAEKSMIKGEAYIFTFTKIGSWSFHNHLNSGHTGTIVVE